MKKQLHKITLRKETLRALSGKEIARVVGGNSDPVQFVAESGDKQCTAQVIPPGG